MKMQGPSGLKATDILQKAADLVGGDRAESYGPMEENFDRISVLWNAWLQIRRDPAAPLAPEDIGYMMMLMKLARTQSGPYSPDTAIDMAGYAGCAGQIAATRE